MFSFIRFYSLALVISGVAASDERDSIGVTDTFTQSFSTTGQFSGDDAKPILEHVLASYANNQTDDEENDALRSSCNILASSLDIVFGTIGNLTVSYAMLFRGQDSTNPSQEFVAHLNKNLDSIAADMKHAGLAVIDGALPVRRTPRFQQSFLADAVDAPAISGQQDNSLEMIYEEFGAIASKQDASKVDCIVIHRVFYPNGFQIGFLLDHNTAQGGFDESFIATINANLESIASQVGLSTGYNVKEALPVEAYPFESRFPSVGAPESDDDESSSAIIGVSPLLVIAGLLSTIIVLIT